MGDYERAERTAEYPPDLDDPLIRAHAVAAAARELQLGLAVCPDRARFIAARAVSAGYRAAVDFAKRDGQHG
jgi:hypothetical protein